jgi:hypothetical protein
MKKSVFTVSFIAFTVFSGICAFAKHKKSINISDDILIRVSISVIIIKNGSLKEMKL